MGSVERTQAIVVAWHSRESEPAIAEKHNISRHAVQGAWIAARRAGLLPSGIKRFSPRWHDLQDGKLFKPAKPPSEPHVVATIAHDGICGAPTVGTRDLLLERLQKAHA